MLARGEVVGVVGCGGQQSELGGAGAAGTAEFAAQRVRLLVGEFGTGTDDVEDVDGLSALGFDKDDFDVVVVLGEAAG